jgi:hypothetical protein
MAVKKAGKKKHKKKTVKRVRAVKIVRGVKKKSAGHAPKRKLVKKKSHMGNTRRKAGKGTRKKAVQKKSKKKPSGKRKKRHTTHAAKIHCVVKRGKETMCHAYDEKKVYGSVYAACAVVHMKERECGRIAERVMNAVTRHARKKKMITSDEIAILAAAALRKHSKDAAFMYETHRDVN